MNSALIAMQKSVERAVGVGLHPQQLLRGGLPVFTQLKPLADGWILAFCLSDPFTCFLYVLKSPWNSPRVKKKKKVSIGSEYVKGNVVPNL